MLHLIEMQGLAGEVIQNSPRGTHNNLRAELQSADLAIQGLATIHCEDTDAFEVFTTLL